MVLEENQGALKRSKSGKGIIFVDKTGVFYQYFVAPEKAVKAFLENKFSEVNFSLIVADERENTTESKSKD